MIKQQEYPIEQIFEARNTSTKARLFKAGHLKLLILNIISKEPQYGYDIIKTIGGIVGGNYQPSAGAIYPSLSFLQQKKWIDVEIDESNRKRYVISQQGIDYLKLHQDKAQQILTGFETRREIHSNPQLIDIKRAMENLKTALRLKLNVSELDLDLVQEIAQKIDRAAGEIGRL